MAIIIKAAPQVGRRHGEIVCVAGIDYDGSWHRLYPVPFRDLTNEQRFDRWDLINFEWSTPADDDRPESKRINAQTVKLVGSVPLRERNSFVRRALRLSLDNEMANDRSLALIQPTNPRFIIHKQTPAEFKRSQTARQELHDQLDMFSKTVVEREPPPYIFNYHFRFDGKDRQYQCIDWETEATFFKWRRLYGESKALEEMQAKFGEEWPRRGIAFAMGTHRVKIFGSWLLSGILRLNEDPQGLLL